MTLFVLKVPFLKRLRIICRGAAEIVSEVWWPFRVLGEGGKREGGLGLIQGAQNASRLSQGSRKAAQIAGGQTVLLAE